MCFWAVFLYSDSEYLPFSAWLLVRCVFGGSPSFSQEVFTFQRLAGGWAVCLRAVLNCNRESLPFSAWMVVGCVFAGIAGVCTVVALVCYCLKKKGKPGRVVHPSHYCHHHPHTDPSVVYTGKNRSHQPLDLKLQVLVTGQITFLCPRLFSKYSKTV